MGSLFSLKTFIVDFVYVFMYFLHTFHFHPYQIIEKIILCKKIVTFTFLLCLVCGLMSQSTALVV